MNKVGMNPIVHFEIPADDVDRARKFYTDIFGWEMEEYPMGDGEAYWIVRTAEVDADRMLTKPGMINGGMMKRKSPDQTFMNYVSVDDIDVVLGTINENGGMTIMPKQEIGKDMGWIAIFKDTEGNLMGLHQMPEQKK